ncbi:7-cyano-7-deazaguanine synthase [Acidianus sulfidivorans JP7]|uniref:7-cyano-7-deazaguanine synthase n=1 Tax=Acidianus sulfidivorans JP7 TaxID=619593 RepID=A0A2U9IPD7_9CREN|nr:7-cyano-7-deazaguanine synthase [Acidianus sulfidivorans]AWR97871.1 7-cyano-7-deazaguanine synthase [Acidianus sulfidivorans JP7]
MKSLLLLSGGLDSTSALYYLKNEISACLFIDYGQKSARMERKFAKLNCDLLGKKLIEIKIPSLGKSFYEGEYLRPHEPIVHRNAILLSIALTYAKEKNYDEVIFTTVNEECKYETNKPAILNAMKELANAYNVKLRMPFLNLSKSIVLQIGIRNGLKPEYTYSCLLGHAKHCGKCSQCELRKLAFKALKINDPTIYMS